MFTTEIGALISLLDDPDERIFLQVRDEIIAYGEKILPRLLQQLELHDRNELLRVRLGNLIGHIQYEGIYQRIERWLVSEDHPLLDAALILNRYEYPGYEESELRNSLFRIRQDIWLELNDHLTAVEQVLVVNKIFFELYGFKITAHQNGRNILPVDILESKAGSPIGLGLIYACLCQSLDLPIQPAHPGGKFMLSYTTWTPDIASEDPMALKEEILFYIDPTNGEILNPSQIESSKNALNELSSGPEFMAHLLGQLIHFYIAADNQDKVRELKTLTSLLLERA